MLKRRADFPTNKGKIMAADNSKAIATLNNLIAISKDGEGGYRVASEHVKNFALKTLFESYRHQREGSGDALHHAVRNLGGDPQENGSVAGVLLRGWASIKAVVTGGDENAIIGECERSEAIAMKAYEEALKEDLPEDVRTLVERQLAEIKEARDRICALGAACSQLA